MVNIKLTKSGQVFSIDYIIGFVMFIIIMVIAGKQLINILPSNSYSQLYDENAYFSTNLLQPGYPQDWNPGNVLIPGIASSNRLDPDKLNDLNSFTYDELKSFFHIATEQLFYFQKNDSIIKINGNCVYGYNIPFDAVTCEPNISNLGYSNLVRSSRLLIYNSTIVEMVLISWN